jgi:hypothetical protein
MPCSAGLLRWLLLMPSDLKAYIKKFKTWLNSSAQDAVKWKTERKERLTWYDERLSRDKLSKLSRDDFSALIKRLWAVNIWHNKDYKVQKLLDENGLDAIRSALLDLLYGKPPIEIRWDTFRATIKGLGPSSLSEILTFFDPQQYALVNLKPYEVLPRLGYFITDVKDGKSYKKATDDLAKIKSQLEEGGIADVDFIVTDFFVAYLFYEVFELQGKRKAPIVAPPPSMPAPHIGEARENTDIDVNSHEAAEAILLMLGNLLGYDTYTPDASRTFEGRKLGEIATLEDLPPFTAEKIMDSVRNIDVVWIKDEWPEYFFEVEHTTGVTPGLLRIFQARKLSTKFFIIGPKDVLKRFEREVLKAPFNAIKEKYCFRSYEELHEMYLATTQYRKVSDGFLG